LPRISSVTSMSTMFSSNSASSSTPPFPPRPRPAWELDVVVRLAMTAIVPSPAAWCAPTRHGCGPRRGPSGGRKPTIYPDYLPGDVVAGPAREEHRSPGKVTRKPVAAHHRPGRQGTDPGRVGRYLG